MEENSEKYVDHLNKFYRDVRNSRRLDESFSLTDDIPLTDDEVNEINEFWGKYKFAYPEIDYKSFKTFKNRFGKFDVRHCPGSIRTQYFRKHFVNRMYVRPGENKALSSLLYPCIKHPVTVIKYMDGVFFNKKFTPIKFNEVVDILLSYVKEDKGLIVKPSNLGGGAGIQFIDQNDTKETITEKLECLLNCTFVIQELIVQSDFMKQFNVTSVNTIRATTLLFEGEVHFLAALVRIGKEGNKVDNYSQGGSLLGIDIKTGKCNKWALTHDNERITVLPSGVNLEEVNLVVPNFNKIVKKIKQLHYYMPYQKLISWDIALDETNSPVLIENNFAGMLQIHEAVTGPLFGDLMEKLLDKYLLEEFFIEFNTEDWVCKEYADKIVIKKYIGKADTAFVPEKVNGKFVESIEANAFQNSQAKKVNMPVRVSSIKVDSDKIDRIIVQL